MDTIYGGTIVFLWILFSIASFIIYHKVFAVYYFNVGEGLLKEFVYCAIVGAILAALALKFSTPLAIIIAIVGFLISRRLESKGARAFVFVIFIALALIVFGVGQRFNVEDNGTNNNIIDYSKTEAGELSTADSKTEADELPTVDSKTKVGELPTVDNATGITQFQLEKLLQIRRGSDVRTSLGITEDENIFSYDATKSNWISYDGFIWVYGTENLLYETVDANIPQYQYYEQSGVFVTGNDNTGVEFIGIFPDGDIPSIFPEKTTDELDKFMDNSVQREFSIFGLHVGDTMADANEVFGDGLLEKDNTIIYLSPVGEYLVYVDYSSSVIQSITFVGNEMVKESTGGIGIAEFVELAPLMKENSNLDSTSNATTSSENDYYSDNADTRDMPSTSTSNAQELSSLWGKWVLDDEWYIELSEGYFVSTYQDGPMRIDDYYFEGNDLHVYFSVNPFDTGFVWSYYGVVNGNTMTLSFEIGEGYGYDTPELYYRDGYEGPDADILEDENESGNDVCGYDYNGSELRIGYVVRIGANEDGTKYAVGTIVGYTDIGNVQVNFTEVYDTDEYGQVDYYYIDGIADEISANGSAVRFVDSSTVQILIFG